MVFPYYALAIKGKTNKIRSVYLLLTLKCDQMGVTSTYLQFGILVWQHYICYK